jgi:DNA/RNA endonuclease YhcR with UshA esterase domain
MRVPRVCSTVAAASLWSLATVTLAFDSIAPADAINHVGERAIVCGQVASAKYAEQSNGSPTFLNLDRPYPQHVFTAVIWGTSRSRFPSPPEALSGSRICVSGEIDTYRGRAQIEVSDPDQIRSVK